MIDNRLIYDARLALERLLLFRAPEWRRYDLVNMLADHDPIERGKPGGWNAALYCAGYERGHGLGEPASALIETIFRARGIER